MFKHNLKVAWRSLLRNRLFSFINVTGLAVGLAASIVIMLWVRFEKSHDRFHANHDRLATVMSNEKLEGDFYTGPATSTPLAQTLKANFPDVQDAARVTWGDMRVFHYNNLHIEENGLYADPSFLRMFSFPLVKGDKATALTQPNTVLLSETAAKKYFGTEDPIGKTLGVDEGPPCQVVGVFQEVPKNSTLRFDFLMPVADYIKQTMNGEENWDNHNIRTFIQLRPGADEAAVAAKIERVAAQNGKESGGIRLSLHPARDWYLRNNFKEGKNAGGKITYVNIFSLVAVFVLLIACINFMNLSTAQATQRAKEVGVRKSIGGNKASLLRQFLGESLLVTVVAGALALLLVTLVLPAINSLLQRDLRLPVNEPTAIGYFLLLLGVTAVLAGGYPAFVLSSLQPTQVLKGGMSRIGGKSQWLRRGLVVGQFAVSVVMIIGAGIVYQQVNFFRNKNLGYNRANLVYFPSGGLTPEHYESFKNELKGINGVRHVTRSSITFNGSNNMMKEVTWPGKQEGKDVLFDVVNTDYDVLPTFGMRLKEGRNFSAEFADSNAVILNAEAVRQMGLKGPVAGTVIRFRDEPRTVVGVVDDFHITSLQHPLKPLILKPRDWTWTYFLRIEGARTAAVLKDIERVYKDRVPDRPLTIHFMDKEYERMYGSEVQIGTLSKWFAVFAIFISCLGLFGLVSLAAAQRTKEIGIRKVLGASVANILALLSKDFLFLVLIAVLIAFPLAWWGMSKWLQEFAYRIAIPWWLFLLAGAGAALVALATVSVRSIWAANANPVKSLRTE